MSVSRPLRVAGRFILWYDRGMKVAVSIPDALFSAGEALGKRLKLSRSRLYATALAEFVAKHQGRRLTEQLDAVYAEQESRLEPGLDALQRRSVGRSTW
jgi:metal-responsive CopG/Arc/MetJ family transcriptional regulator